MSSSDIEESFNRWEEIFKRQTDFMEELRKHDRLPEWPLDLKTKPAQRQVKELIFYIVEELAEASFTLKNKVHRLSDDQAVDFEHFKEELGDALAYFVEICIMAGISHEQMYQEYRRKNKIVFERLAKGY